MKPSLPSIVTKPRSLFILITLLLAGTLSHDDANFRCSRMIDFRGYQRWRGRA